MHTLNVWVNWVCRENQRVCNPCVCPCGFVRCRFGVGAVVLVLEEGHKAVVLPWEGDVGL